MLEIDFKFRYEPFYPPHYPPFYKSFSFLNHFTSVLFYKRNVLNGCQVPEKLSNISENTLYSEE